MNSLMVLDNTAAVTVVDFEWRKPSDGGKAKLWKPEYKMMALVLGRQHINYLLCHLGVGSQNCEWHS